MSNNGFSRIFSILALAMIFSGLACVLPETNTVQQNTPESETQAVVETMAISSSPGENTTINKNSSLCATGKPAPSFKLTSLKNEVIALSDFHGKRVIINFWATWCQPCKRELPYLESYYRQNKDINRIILTICSDSELFAINDYVQISNITLPILVDRNGKTRRSYSYDSKKLLVIPTTFFVNEQGILVKISRHEFSGFADIVNIVNGINF